MIAEISAIVAGVNMASTTIKKAASTADDLSTIGTFLTQLCGAEVELAKAQNQGRESEADAGKTAHARKQIAETRQEVKYLFVMCVNGHLYQQCMQGMANARKAKQEELARATAKNKKFWKDMRQIWMLILLFVVLVPDAVGALLAYLTR